MARYTGPVCRKCRREGIKLFLKGTRCDTNKCAMERQEMNRHLPPGSQTFRRGKMTDYAIHLREKQKVKNYYGVLERQFRKYYKMADRMKGNTGENLMSLLERRLDNIVHRLGFGLSRSQARQIINHGHITVNGRRVDVASYLIKPGDVIKVKDRAKSKSTVETVIGEFNHQVPDFLMRVEGQLPEGRVLRMPEREDVSIPVEPQLIVELCSK